jgi:hypothetical protein
MSDPNLISVSPAVCQAFTPILQAVTRDQGRDVRISVGT